ncbi:MAG: response regulator [Myxococcota bacterium]
MADGLILLVEDDVPLAELVAASLRREGYTVELQHRGDQAVAHIQRLDPDLVILDVMLPGADGFEILRQLRPAWTKPVLMLTAREEDFDQVTGLELGADDYVIKPVLPRVLQARVRAMLRRAAAAAPKTSDLVFGGLRIIPSAREVRAHDTVIEFTDSEYDLLEYLANNAGRTIDRDELFRELRGIEYDGLDRSMDLRISKLRSRLRDELGGRSPVRTVHGRGYLFAVTP